MTGIWIENPTAYQQKLELLLVHLLQLSLEVRYRRFLLSKIPLLALQVIGAPVHVLLSVG